MSILKKLVTQPIVAKYFLNHFAPFKGAGIQIEKFDLKHYHIRVKIPSLDKTETLSAYILVGAYIQWSTRFI